MLWHTEHLSKCILLTSNKLVVRSHSISFWNVQSRNNSICLIHGSLILQSRGFVLANNKSVRTQHMMFRISSHNTNFNNLMAYKLPWLAKPGSSTSRGLYQLFVLRGFTSVCNGISNKLVWMDTSGYRPLTNNFRSRIMPSLFLITVRKSPSPGKETHDHWLTRAVPLWWWAISSWLTVNSPLLNGMLPFLKVAGVSSITNNDSSLQRVVRPELYNETVK